MQTKTMSVCRSCLCASPMHNIFENTGDTSIYQRFIICADLQISSDDGLPSNICDKCLNELNIAYQFRIKCKSSDEELRQRALQIEKHDLTDRDNIDYLDAPSLNNDVDCNVSDSDCTISKLKSDKRKKTKKPKERNKPKCGLVKVRSSLERKAKLKLKKDDINIEELNDTAADKSKKHMCTTCGKTFLFNRNLIDHERVHSGDKPYKCNVCNRRFAQAGHLMVHERRHSGVKPYKCDICPRAFTVSHTLKKHLRTHTGERPYTCKICNKSFVTSYHLSNHHKRHMGEKTYKCDWPGCQYGFVNFSEMKRHRCRHEKNFSPKSLNKSNLKNIHERLQSIPLIRLEELSTRFNNLDRERQPMYSELVQITPEYLHNVQNMTLYHNQIGTQSQFGKNVRCSDVD